MLTLAEKKFKRLVLQLFQKHQNNLVLTVRTMNEALLDTEVRIPDLGNVAFRAIVTSSSTNHMEEDPDPRQFGDSQAVTASAMVGWYPGKMVSYTRHRRNFVLQAWNLPGGDMTDFTATYEYDPTSCNNEWHDGYELEKIFQLLTQVKNKQERAFKAGLESAYADQLEEAFKRLSK